LDRKWYLHKNYGLTFDDYNTMLKKQHNRCAICQAKLIKVCVDHDHCVHLTRDLLCDDCNTLLGRADDDVEILTRAISYLKRWKHNYKKWSKNMPIHRVNKGMKPAYQWGESGKKYTYTTGDTASRMRAKKLAIRQGLAVARRTGKTPEL
jgi:hypothetical protein